LLGGQDLADRGLQSFIPLDQGAIAIEGEPLWPAATFKRVKSHDLFASLSQCRKRKRIDRYLEIKLNSKGQSKFK
jgi:hypothetical protein